MLVLKEVTAHKDLLNLLLAQAVHLNLDLIRISAKFAQPVFIVHPIQAILLNVSVVIAHSVQFNQQSVQTVHTLIPRINV